MHIHIKKTKQKQNKKRIKIYIDISLHIYICMYTYIYTHVRHAPSCITGSQQITYITVAYGYYRTVRLFSAGQAFCQFGPQTWPAWPADDISKSIPGEQFRLERLRYN